MKIIVMDGHTLNPGDLSWETLEALGDVTVYDRTPADEIVPRARGAEILLTNKTPFRAETLSQLPGLRYIGVMATGYDVVETSAARECGVTVTNVPTYATDAVAQMTFALLLELCHHVGAHSEAVRRGEWTQCADFCFWNYPLVELAGKTMGLVGFGRIGRRVAEIAPAFGMKVLASDVTRRNPPAIEDFAWADVPELLKQSDVVSLHCPLTPETKGLIDAKALALMKPSAFLINTSRGGLVDVAALADALNAGRLAGAALDVLPTEPAAPDNPLLKAANCMITPHIAWAARESRARLMATVVHNVRAFLDGRAANVVS